GVDTEERFKLYIFVVPRIFAIFAFIAVLIGTISASENLPSPYSGNEYEVRLRSFLASHLITLSFATACIIIIFMMRDIFISYYRRRMERMERNDPEICKKTLMRIESLTRDGTRKHEDHDLHLTALKPDFVTRETWVAAQRAKLVMWVYMSALTWFLL